MASSITWKNESLFERMLRERGSGHPMAAYAKARGDAIGTAVQSARPHAELAVDIGRVVATAVGRKTFDAAKLVWSPVMMGAEAFGDVHTKAGALGAYNAMDKWKNILFPDIMKAAEPGHIGFDPETGDQIPWQPKDSLLKGLESMAMKPPDLAKVPAKAVIDLTVGTGTLLPGKLSKPFDVASEFYDKTLAPSNSGEGNEVLSGLVELATMQGLKKPLLKQAAKAGRFDVGKRLLSGDRVPESIFGIPVVSTKDQYTEADLQFFSEHPEAGGYYQTDDDEENQESQEEPVVQADEKGGDTGWDPYRNAESAVKLVIPFIKKHEAFREKAYFDPVGKWTVGYGQTETNGRPVQAGDTIAEPDAAKFVERRVRSNAAALYKDRTWSRNVGPNALAALYDIAYNAGVAALSPKKSPGLNAEMEAADMDFDSIVWNQVPTHRSAGGMVLQGLVNRRADAVKEWRKD